MNGRRTKSSFLSPREQQAPTFDDQPPSSLRIYGARPVMHGHWQQSRIPLAPPPQKVLIFSIFISISVSLQSCLYLIFRLLPQLFMHIHHIIDQDPSLFLSLSTLLYLYFFYLPHIEHSVLPIALSTYLPTSTLLSSPSLTQSLAHSHPPDAVSHPPSISSHPLPSCDLHWPRLLPFVGFEQ